jgi:hypothetical protein
MPEKKTLDRARADKRAGKSASTQAGEFVREEMHHVREGKHGARNAQQAIAIGLSKARRAGVDLKAPPKGSASEKTRKKAKRETEMARNRTKPSPKRSAATTKALKREPAETPSNAGQKPDSNRPIRRRNRTRHRDSGYRPAGEIHA